MNAGAARFVPARALARVVPSLDAIDAELERRRVAAADARVRDDLRAFVVETYPGLVPGWHLDDLCWHLQRFADDVNAKRSPRMIVTMPPRHTKSTTTSQRFPVWGMANWQWNVILATYGQELADDHSRDARQIARSERVVRAWPDCLPPREAKAHYADFRRTDVDKVRGWTIGGPIVDGFRRKGRYKAVGVGGPLTGSGADVLVIDDPHKDRAEADSASNREAVWRWYTSTAYTRLAPGAGVLLVQTRWNDDDLAGRLLRAMADGGEQWTLINFPAIAERDEYGPDGVLRRREGEALHPARYDLTFLQRIKALNEYDFASLYQQRPVPAEGAIVKSAWLQNRFEPLQVPAPVQANWQHVSAASPLRRVPFVGADDGLRAFRLLSVDTAYKEGEHNDYTAIGSMVELGQRVALADVTRRRLEFPALVAMLLSLAERDDPHVVLVEDKGSGQSLIQQLRADRRWRWSIVPIDTKGQGKVTRLSTETPWLQSGRLLLPQTAPWLPELERELLTFPAGAHDDQVDMLSQALAYLRQRLERGTLSAWSSVRR